MKYRRPIRRHQSAQENEKILSRRQKKFNHHRVATFLIHLIGMIRHVRNYLITHHFSESMTHNYYSQILILNLD